jgi:predicted nucleic acid-binding protein
LPRVNRYVFASYALIGYLENEPFSGLIETILKKAKRKTVQAYLHAIHLGEVYYIILREQGQALANLAYTRIRAFPLIYVDTIDEELLLTAAALKANYPISYADAFAAAMAVNLNCRLVTGDPEYKILESKGVITTEWLT